MASHVVDTAVTHRVKEEEKEAIKPDSAEFLLSRHFSTIGIGDVFLCPPGHELLSVYLQNEANSKPKSFDSWEFVGKIKANPEDFIVSEVAPDSRRIPGLTEQENMDFKDAKTAFEGHGKIQKFENKQVAQSDEPKLTSTEEAKPVDGIKESTSLQDYLEEAFGGADDVSAKVNAILHDLKELQCRKLRLLEEDTTSNEMTMEDNPVSIPPFKNDQNQARELRRQLHRFLKIDFPLVESKTVAIEMEGGTEKDYKVTAEINTSLDQLIPYLAKPSCDLVSLYEFRARGVVASELWNGEHASSKRHRDGRQKDTANNRGSVILRLQPDLDKNSRRVIHGLLSKTCRDFATSTIPDYPLDKQENTDSKAETTSTSTTTAICVQWSKHAVQREVKKFKAKEDIRNGTNDPFENCFCVLKKRQKEHLTAIQILAATLKCRPTDIGLAGIKDMQAVTYQFVTFRNLKPRRIHNNLDRIRQQGLNLNSVFKVDWLLNSGNLQGNIFEIIIRNIQRIQVISDSYGVGREFYVPCTAVHLEEMSIRISSSGFINFFGDQRVGAPGTTKVVGYRSFDIGRGMLQRDYASAVDMLMRGRLFLSSGSSSSEFHSFRKVWADTEGDVDKTLKALPGGNTVPRERAVLKGLKRYGKDKPLEALKCVNYNMRTLWIHAYQSYVWNIVATERLKRFGANVMKGDLYFEKRDSAKTDIKIVLSDLDISSVKLSQVVLPLPGHDVQYPDNAIGQLFKECLEKDGISFDKSGPAESTAKGSYRYLIACPKYFKFECVEGDRDEMRSVKVSFELAKGSYATMLLREFMVKTAGRSAND